MKMIGHQAIGQHAHRPSPASFLDSLDEGRIVGVFMEDLGASVDTIEDVVAVVA